MCVAIVFVLWHYGVFSDKDKPTAPTAPKATPAPTATTQAPPPPSPLPSPLSLSLLGPPVQVVTCETKLADAEWGQAGGASVRGRKVSLVGQLDDGSDACTDEAVKKVVERNKDKLFQSAYKMESQDGASIYYLSQFVDSKIPAALSEPDRLSYKKFVGKTPGQKGNFEGAADAPGGLQCELITGQDVSTKDKVETVCSNDDRCVGYYTSSTTGFSPVMAMAANGGCTLSWMKLPSADQPTETDVCTKFMGDKEWHSETAHCAPKGCDSDARTNAGYCWKYNPNCAAGFGRCKDCAVWNPCVPVTEEKCPVGWILERTNEYPSGVCKPACHKSATSREFEGYCEVDRSHWESTNPPCVDGYDVAYTANRTYCCRPNAAALKKKYYQSASAASPK
jgi:hypothetical protein